MTKKRRIVLLLAEIFMLLGALLAFSNFFTISSKLSELVAIQESPEVPAQPTAETVEWMKVVADLEGSLALTGAALQVCSWGLFLNGCLLLGGSLIHFFVTPWKLKQKAGP